MPTQVESQVVEPSILIVRGLGLFCPFTEMVTSDKEHRTEVEVIAYRPNLIINGRMAGHLLTVSLMSFFVMIGINHCCVAVGGSVNEAFNGSIAKGDWRRFGDNQYIVGR